MTDFRYTSILGMLLTNTKYYVISKKMTYQVAIFGIEFYAKLKNDRFFGTVGAHMAKISYSQSGLPPEAHDGLFPVTFPTFQFRIGTLF